jgi:hypothetical protein
MTTLPPRVREARLLKSSAEDVFRDLEAEAAATNVRAAFWSRDDELDRSLFARNDPLINLAIAHFGTDKDIVRAVYRAATLETTDLLSERYNLGLRVACLSNTRVDYGFSWEFPLNIVGPEEFARLVNYGNYDEFTAFLQNPRVHDKYLAALYTRSEPFSALDDLRWRWLVDASANNPRLTTERESREDPDLGFWEIHKGLARLLEIAPTTQDWTRSIYALVRKLRTDHTIYHRPQNLSSVLQRWRTAEIGAGSNGPEEGWFTGLPLNEELCCYLAALYDQELASMSKVDADDIATRCAHYGNSKLDPKDFEGFYQRDREVFVMAALLNDELLRDWQTREPFELYISSQNRSVFDARMKEFRRGSYGRYITEKPAELPSRPVEASDELQFARYSYDQIVSRLDAIRSSATGIGWALLGAVLLGFLFSKH